MAPDMFLEPIDWIDGRTSHCGFLGITVVHDVFTDLDFADNVSILAEMLEVIILALEIMHEESFQLGLRIKNWNKTKIQTPESLQGAPSMVPVLGHQVEVEIGRASCRERV